MERKLAKLKRRNKVAFDAIGKKSLEILEDPYRFKPLRPPLFGKRRVHIDSNFVLVYSIDENAKAVHLLDYDHHDRIYQK
jgi:mRNA-degrading endonuclease RelE of RelBE toxin-antitoxin system